MTTQELDKAFLEALQALIDRSDAMGMAIVSAKLSDAMDHFLRIVDGGNAADLSPED